MKIKDIDVVEATDDYLYLCKRYKEFPKIVIANCGSIAKPRFRSYINYYSKHYKDLVKRRKFDIERGE